MTRLPLDLCQECGGHKPAHQWTCSELLKPLGADIRKFVQDRLDAVTFERDQYKAERDLALLQNERYRKALEKIAFAEESEHDAACEMHGGTAYCACDARIAADVLNGAEKRICEKCKGNYHTGPCDPRCEIHGLEFCEACKYPF